MFTTDQVERVACPRCTYRVFWSGPDLKQPSFLRPDSCGFSIYDYNRVDATALYVIVKDLGGMFYQNETFECCALECFNF